jgi:pyruvate dehydrogenase E2 component (dihydrolipoamide acetyltransferase)
MSRVEFHLPDIGEGIATVEIVEWHVKAGDEVVEDAPMVDVQTDKAINEIRSPVAGTVDSTFGEVGDEVPVGTLLITFESDGAAAADPASAGAAPSAPSPAPGAAPPAQPSAPEAQSNGGQVPLASPAVRKAAGDRGIDLTAITGTGPGDRITREDLEASTTASSPASVRPAGPPTEVDQAEDRVERLVGTRRVIARTLTESWQSVPHVMDFREADVTALLRARDAIQERARRRGHPEPRMISTFVLIAKLAAVTARRHPALRSSIDMEREEITRYGAVNLSIPVAAADGLVTPVIPNADRLSLVDLAQQIADVVAAARERKLTPSQLQGGTFTVNNYGSLGSPLGTTLVQPGQSSNLGLGRVTKRAVVRDDAVVIRPMISFNCTVDHRVMDGAEMQAYTGDLVEVIEEPSLVLDELV